MVPMQIVITFDHLQMYLFMCRKYLSWKNLMTWINLDQHELVLSNTLNIFAALNNGQLHNIKSQIINKWLDQL